MFKKAVRNKVKLKLAITGPTGSGKTYSALRLAKGLGGKIAVIDTENGSASLYSQQFEFDVLDMKPPFTTEKYIEAINAAEKAGYQTIIIDSLTHAWAGEGGLLEQKAQLDSRPNSNHWTNWGPIDKKDQALKNAFLHSTCDVIATMRSKMEYAQGEENGKKKVQKVGLAPVQRDGLTYDFTIVFDVAMDHQVEVSKDRTGLFADQIFKITEETGEKIKVWHDGGGDPAPVLSDAKENKPTGSRAEVGPQNEQHAQENNPKTDAMQTVSNENEAPRFDTSEAIDKPKDETPITISDAKNLYELVEKKKRSVDSFNKYLQKEYGVSHARELKRYQYSQVMEFLQ